MIRTLGLCALALGLFGLVLGTPQTADARCYRVTLDSTHGVFKGPVSNRATRQLKRHLRRNGYALAGTVYTDCAPHRLHMHCKAWARACR